MSIGRIKAYSSKELALIAALSSLWITSQIYLGPLVGRLTGEHGVIQRFLGWLLMLLMARLTNRFGRVTLMVTVVSLATRIIRPGALYALFTGLGYALGGLIFDLLYFFSSKEAHSRKTLLLSISLISGLIASIPYMLYRFAFLGFYGFLLWLPFYLPDLVRGTLLSVAGTLTGLLIIPKVEARIKIRLSSE
jgi:signal transduction histidine kinase